MDQYNIIQEYMEIHPWSMTPELMHSAFSTTGIFPFNDTLITNDDFALAKSFSHTMHIPKSFPTKVPSSPPVVSDVSDLETSGNESDPAESIATDAPAAQTWETDSDDFDYELALDGPSHLPAPTAAATPLEALPCQLAMPAVPIAGTITSESSSSRMPAMLATSTIPALCSSPIMPITPITPPVLAPLTMSHYVGTSGSPRPDDATSDDVGPHSTAHMSPYYTWSQVSQMASLSLDSSPALSVSIALDPTRAPQPQSIEELLSENRRLWLTVELMTKEVEKSKANNDASNAHCTIMT
jgi:hypothetical protein